MNGPGGWGAKFEVSHESMWATRTLASVTSSQQPRPPPNHPVKWRVYERSFVNWFIMHCSACFVFLVGDPDESPLLRGCWALQRPHAALEKRKRRRQTPSEADAVTGLSVPPPVAARERRRTAERRETRVMRLHASREPSITLAEPPSSSSRRGAKPLVDGTSLHP